MPASIWRCSGSHWARVTIAWIAFAAVLASLSQGGGGHATMQAAAVQLTQLAVTAPDAAGGSGSWIRHDVRDLDVNSLDEQAFGDVEALATAR